MTRAWINEVQINKDQEEAMHTALVSFISHRSAQINALSEEQRRSGSAMMGQRMAAFSLLGVFDGSISEFPEMEFCDELTFPMLLCGKAVPRAYVATLMMVLTDQYLNVEETDKEKVTTKSLLALFYPS